MGVYVFRTLHAPYVKVGHHLVCPRRPHAYYRVAGRGFESVKHPEELTGRLGMRDLELVAWYPSLTRADECRVHKSCTTRVGEFHEAWELDAILAMCDAVAPRVSISKAEERKAEAWGRRRARAAARVRARKTRGTR